MSGLKKIVTEKLKELVPNYEKLEVCIYVTDKSYSLEFFANIEGERIQCFEMIDDGSINEVEFDRLVKDIAAYVRKMSEYKTEEVNKFYLEILSK